MFNSLKKFIFTARILSTIMVIFLAIFPLITLIMLLIDPYLSTGIWCGNIFLSFLNCLLNWIIPLSGLLYIIFIFSSHISQNLNKSYYILMIIYCYFAVISILFSFYLINTLFEGISIKGMLWWL